MRLYTFGYNGREYPGALSMDGKSLIPASAAGFECSDMNELISGLTDEGLKRLSEAVKNGSPQAVPIEAVKKCPPIPYPKQDIICLGINYAAHAEESARFKKEAFGGERPYAVYFSKRVNRAVADGEAIDGHFDINDSLDYEAELAVIIGRDALNVSMEAALEYVLGYTVMNDVSARSLQTRHKQWYFGKGLDGFTPLGPCIVTADEFEGEPQLDIYSKVNGELRQNANTRDLIFGISHVIHELSQGMTLKAGTIIAMGTPAGVGMGFEPPKFLKQGDVVECGIKNIGSIVNIVK